MFKLGQLGHTTQISKLICVQVEFLKMRQVFELVETVDLVEAEVQVLQLGQVADPDTGLKFVPAQVQCYEPTVPIKVLT